MKQRLISVFFGLLLLASVLLLFNTAYTNVIFAAVGGLCIFEGLRAYKLNGNILLLGALELVHLLNMFFRPDMGSLAFAMIFAMFALLVARDGAGGSFSQGAAAAVIALTVTMGFRAMLELRDSSPYEPDGVMLFFMGLALAWVCDAFAFLVGRLCGKRKLAPAISPNKTVEGAVGGIVGTALFSALALWFYAKNASAESALAGMSSVKFILLFALLGAVGAMCGILGDLAMSFVKRDAGIKDFGRIMPGHGGALDRMDSALFSSIYARIAFALLLGAARQ